MNIYTSSRTGVHRKRKRHSPCICCDIFRTGKEERQHDVLRYFHENSNKLREMVCMLIGHARAHEIKAVIELLTAHEEGEIEEAQDMLRALPPAVQRVIAELGLIEVQ